MCASSEMKEFWYLTAAEREGLAPLARTAEGAMAQGKSGAGEVGPSHALGWWGGGTGRALHRSISPPRHPRAAAASSAGSARLISADLG